MASQERESAGAQGASAPSGSYASFGARLLGAARFDPALFDAVGRDRKAGLEAAEIVLLGGLARGLWAYPVEGLRGFVVGTVLAPVFWLIASTVVYAIARRIYGRRVEYGPLLRGLGFAAFPLVLLGLGILPIPGLSLFVQLLAHTLAAVAVVIATRQALESDTIGAVIICTVAVVTTLALLTIVGILFADEPAAGSAG